MAAKKEKKQGEKVGKSYQAISQQIEVASLYLTAADISTWKRAIDTARSVTMPRRRLLYELYENMILDGHLTSVMTKRRIAITNKKLNFVMDDESDAPEGLHANILDTPWMYELLGHAIDQVAYGHSLVELQPVEGRIGKVELMPRMNVRPEDTFLQFNYADDTRGFNFCEDPKYKNFMIAFGGRKDYGLMMQAAQYVIYKRGGFGDWADFAELFGMPFRVGKYNPHDPETRDKLKTALRDAGSAGWLVIPEGSSIEFFNPTQTGQSDIFDNLRKACNEELSKLFLGQTMTTDNGSSRSQGEVHKEVEDEISLSDMIRLEYDLNWQFKPKMIALGASDLQGGNIRFQSTSEIPIDKRIEIDVKLNKELRAMGKEIPEEYWVKTYGIDNPVDASQPVNADPVSPDPNEEKVVKKKQTQKKSDPVKAMIGAFYEANKSSQSVKITAAKNTLDPIWDAVVKAMHDGRIKKGDIDPELFKWIKDELMKAVTEGYGNNLSAYAPDTPDYAMLQKLENNVHVFSGYKTYHELREATKQLVDENGVLRSFSDFKNAVASINEVFNVAYLQTEYNLAVASSQMAEKWQGFEATKDTFPLLQYSTVGDDVVRDSHKVLDGIIQPVDSDFWNSHYPPNGWNCRCTVKQLTEGEVSDISKIGKATGMFNNNVGKNGVIYPKDHPYFTVDKEDKPAIKQALNDLNDGE